MIGAATTSRAPLSGLTAASISLQTRSIVVQVGAEDLDADVGAHAGREHLDAVDDRLREDVAPAGHLQDAAHLVVDQVALRPALSRPEEDTRSRTAFPAPARSATNGAKRCRVVRLAELAPASTASAKRAVSSPCAAPFSSAWSLARLGQFLQGVPGEGLDAAVEQLPVDLLDALAPQVERARRSTACSTSPANVLRLAAEHLGRLAARALRRRFSLSASASDRVVQQRRASRKLLGRRRCVSRVDVFQGRAAWPATGRSRASSSVGQLVDRRSSSTSVGPVQVAGLRRMRPNRLRRRRSASAPARVRARIRGSAAGPARACVSSKRSSAFCVASLIRPSRSSACAARSTKPSLFQRAPARRASAATASSNLQHALRPELLGPEVDERLDHVERRRVGRRVGPAGLADDRFDLGKAAQQGVAGLQVVGRLRDAGARHGDRHVERRPLVQRRHEGHADLREVVGPRAPAAPG